MERQWLEELDRKIQELLERRYGGTLTKAKLAEALISRKLATRREAGRLVDAVFELIKASLARGEDVLITGFGKFEVRHKKARWGRNPNTREPALIPAHRSVTFRYSGALRDRINHPQPFYPRR